MVIVNTEINKDILDKIIKIMDKYDDVKINISSVQFGKRNNVDGLINVLIV